MATTALAATNSEWIELWQRRRLLLLSAVLVAATLLLYGPVSSHKFINFDDGAYVYENPHVRTGLCAENLRWAFTTHEMGHWHPLTWLGHQAEYQLFGANPAGHHYADAMLHALNALVLFLLLAAATGALWRPLLVAALFAVHPMNVEAVAWASELKTLLCTLFSFAALAAYGWYARRRGWQRYLLVALALLLALLSKAMAVTLPLAMLIADYWPLGEFAAPVRRWKLLAEKLPLLGICAAFSALAVEAQHESGSLVLSQPLGLRLAHAAVGYVAYLRKAVWPAPLAIHYPYPISAPSFAQLALCLALLGGITVLALLLRRQRWFAAGWLFFLLSLLPVSGVVRSGQQAMADRFAYTPCIGLFIIAVWGGAALWQRLRIPAPAAAVGALLALAALSFTTRTTLAYWQDSLTLFSHAAQVVTEPDEIIEINLGQALAETGNVEQAMTHFTRVLQMNPTSELAHYNIGNYLMLHNRPAESIPEFQTAIRYSRLPQITEMAADQLGQAYLELNRNADAAKAYDLLLGLNPQSFAGYLGRGQALLRLEKYPEAATDLAQAIRLRPAPELYYLMGKALEGSLQPAQALQAYQLALNGNPQLEPARARINALQGKAR